jgi:hypothetical protein
MTNSQAIFSFSALFAASLFVIGGASAPHAQTPNYLFSSNSVSSAQNETKGHIAWRMNASTGAISYCVPGHVTAAPTCSPWSK